MPKRHAPKSETVKLAPDGKVTVNDAIFVVGIGASAGGLDACQKFIGAIPLHSGMAFILIQHLDPTHESMMVELLKAHTKLPVLQADEGMLLEQDHFYIIPPGSYLEARDGVLHLSVPRDRHGARLPFDFLLQALAENYGTNAAAVILSGTGTDGSLGLQAIKAKGGSVFVQKPGDASFEGMPQSAIQTGVVDFILPAADIPEALINLRKKTSTGKSITATGPSALRQIIDLLHEKTDHDFTLYKEGTLRRRIERRMAMTSISADRMDKYLKVLEKSEAERDLLASDLLINVTSFFRDPKVFELLAKKFIPELVESASANKPLRVWVAGCSTGEETYSITMLFLEEISRKNGNTKLQVFASDIDSDAVSTAREGLYPESIAGEVSAARLDRFFSKEEHGYRVLPELRSCVVFTVQDVLYDPPFSRLDFISCRNLLIYLMPDAQAKVVDSFHFALREGGILVLGSAETAGALSSHFEAVSKQDRIYRHTGRRRPGEFGALVNAGDITRAALRSGQTLAPPRQTILSELCRRLVLENFAPAAVLINQKYECLYSLGPTQRYLRMPTGHPTLDFLAMVPPSLRLKLRSALEKAMQEAVRVSIEGDEFMHDGVVTPFTIEVQPVLSEGEPLIFVCFVDAAAQHPQQSGAADRPDDSAKIVVLERRLKAARTELHAAIRNLEISNEEQRVVNEEALSVNEEYQSTNEELLTSKEELQSLNEELTALNSQLQETLERQRTLANDLQNVLYSTDVATLFLDPQLNIRFFTPATKSLFNVLPSDVGRPLMDLHSLASDVTLAADARAVLLSSEASEIEIATPEGLWFNRRILPYRTLDNGVEGVVITYADITERKAVKGRLEEATKVAEMANLAKSRFLAAASHDLRQPLQTLALVQGLLAKEVQSESARKLVKLMDQTSDSMSSMLNTLLDINQIDAGIVRPEIVRFPVNDILEHVREEFSYLAQAQGLIFHVVPCGLTLQSDPHMLEQMIRNLLANALKYTTTGKVLLGCRRHKNMLSIEIWDTGIGIPEDHVNLIFEEYYQLDNPARERGRGLGLGLSIVQRLSKLLGYPVRVKSRQGAGSAFIIDVIQPATEPASSRSASQRRAPTLNRDAQSHSGAILVVEDDPELRGLLEILLKNEGYSTALAANGAVAQDMVTRGIFVPELILADFNLPNGLNGVQTSAKIRAILGYDIPVIVLTGDISTQTLLEISQHDLLHLKKPVKLPSLLSSIRELLAAVASESVKPSATMSSAGAHAQPRTIYVIDDDAGIRVALRAVFEEQGWKVFDFNSAEDFLVVYRGDRPREPRQVEVQCLLVDAYLPGMSGLELLQSLHEAGDKLPSIMMTGNSDVPMAVKAMQAGASDFVEKPISYSELLASLERALEQSQDSGKRSAWQMTAASHVAGLTARQHQIMEMVIAGHPSKNIAADLGISQRTVENHRAAIMKRTESKSLPALARVAFAAGMNER